jgi:hypothetical protein
LQALHTSPVNSFRAEAQKPAFEVIRVPLEALEAFRKTEPLFTEFLIETGRVVVENMPGQPVELRGKHGIRAASN